MTPARPAGRGSSADDPGSAPPDDLRLTDEERRRLLGALASVFNDQDSANLVLRHAGFPRERRPPWTTPIQYWTAITEELDNGIIREPYRRLLREALRVYPTNPVFHPLFRSGRESGNPDRPRVLPAPPPPPPNPPPPSKVPPGRPRATAAELRGRLRAYRVKASRLGLAEDAALLALYSAADAVLTTRPLDPRRAEEAIHAYEKAVHARGEAASGPGREARR